MRVFIGSSTEQRRLVEWLTAFMGKEYAGKLEPVPWTIYWQGGQYTLEHLKHFVEQTDGAILFLTADDKTWYRGTERDEPRDNLVFEAGLFFAEHGRTRTRLLIPNYSDQDPQKRKVAIPTDLLGLTVDCFPWSDSTIEATGLPYVARQVCDNLCQQGARVRLPTSLEFLAKHPEIEQVSSLVGSFRTVLHDGIFNLVQSANVREVDIVVAYRIGDIRRALVEFKKRREGRLRVCLSNMWDDELVAAYRRKYHDRTPEYIREAVIDSIKGLLGPCDISITADRDHPLQIANVTDPPVADYEICLTNQRITYSSYRVDDVAFVIPLDMKKSQDPAPSAWTVARETSPRTFRQYAAEYSQMFQEATRVYHSRSS